MHKIVLKLLLFIFIDRKVALRFRMRLQRTESNFSVFLKKEETEKQLYSMIRSGESGGNQKVKIRMLYRQIQEVPEEHREKQAQLEHRSDLEALRLGLPLPTRYRPFTGNMTAATRIHEREFESIEDLTRLLEAWFADPECRKLEEEWSHYVNWEMREIYYVDDPNDPVIPWIQMAAEQGKTIPYVVNPNYKMPKEQENYRG